MWVGHNIIITQRQHYLLLWSEEVELREANETLKQLEQERDVMGPSK